MKTFLKVLATTVWRMTATVASVITIVYCILRIAMNVALTARIGFDCSSISFANFLPTAIETSWYFIVSVLAKTFLTTLAESWKRKGK